jgi:thiol:disulfide interchange protein DsbD
MIFGEASHKRIAPRLGRGLALLVLLLFRLFPLSAQIHDPVKWQSTVENLTATGADLKFTATIESGWSMYAIDIAEGGPIPTSFAFESNQAFELAGDMEQVTKPEVKEDPFFNNMKIGKFHNLAVFRQKIKILKPESCAVKGQVEYMCCDDKSCLAPTQVDFEIKVNPPVTADAKAEGLPVLEKMEGSPLTQASIESIPAEKTQSPTEVTPLHSPTPVAATSAVAGDSSLWTFFLLAILAGFGGVLTPCVYPMIPMTVSFFMRDEKKRSVGMIKALIFGLSIVLIYALIGVIVALTKQADLINQLVAHWLTNLIFAAIFIAFALSFFGWYEITLPSSFANKVDREADKGNYASAFFMALALVVISFSCTGPVVGGILVASAQGLALKPILGMFGYGLAFALPFTLLAFFPSLMEKLPKSGGWMNSVKVVFAFIMLAFAFYFLSYTDKGLGWNIITRDVFLCIWIVLFALTGYYLLGKIQFAHDSEVRHVGVTRLFIAAASFVFALYLFTGLLGAPLNVVAGLLPAAKNNRMGVSSQAMLTQAPDHLCGVPKYSDHANLHWPHGLQGYFDDDEAVACAKEKNKPVLMIFKGHTCAKCREMEAIIWPDPEVLQLMNEHFVLLALYTDDTTPLPENEHTTSIFDGKVKKTLGQKNMDMEITRFQTNAFPYHVILNTNGETIGKPMGYTSNAEEFRDWLKAGLEKF